MKRWMNSQRDNVPLVSTSPPFDSFPSSPYSHPTSRSVWSPSSDFLDDTSHIDADDSQHVDLPAISRLLTGDIDALLEEEERNRSSQEKNLGDVDLEFAFGGQGNISPLPVHVVVGLQLRLEVPESLYPGEIAASHVAGVVPVILPLTRLQSQVRWNPQFRPPSCLPPLLPNGPFLGDTQIESEVPLGVEVMKALSENQVYNDNASLLSSSPSSKLSPPSRNRDTVDSGHTFGNLLTASSMSIADSKQMRSSARISGDGMYFQRTSNCMNIV